MTGTAWSERQELLQTYGLDVMVVPTHRPMIREDLADAVYPTLDEKHEAIVEEIGALRAEGRPVLVGSTSVRESEQLSARLVRKGIPHYVLNAKNHQEEAEIIAQAGRRGAVTISTNMAGRGVDIVLGGNPELLARERAEEAEARAGEYADEVADRARGRADEAEALSRFKRQSAVEREQLVQAGGLHVIGTAHHDSVRIDNQLRGRAGRQGDPGSSQFFISLEDSLWQKFGEREIAELLHDLAAGNHPRGTPIRSRRVRRILRRLQEKVDHENRGIRRDVLKYDLMVHLQREAIYGWRRTLVSGEGFDPNTLIEELIEDLRAAVPGGPALVQALEHILHIPLGLSGGEEDLAAAARQKALALVEQRRGEAGEAQFDELGRRLLLEAIDELWTDHLDDLERLEDGIGLRAYAELDPVVEWRREATNMWQEMVGRIHRRALHLWFLVDVD